MLRDEFTSVMDARGRDSLLKSLVSFTHRLGFDTVSVTAVVDHYHEPTEFVCIDNTPPSFRDHFEDFENGRLDPVAQHCKCNSVPIVWSQQTYVSAGRAEAWEIQARHGYRTGIALALHLPMGRHFFIGVDRDQPLPDDAAEVTRMAADLQLFAACAQDPALRVLLSQEQRTCDVPLLTHRELESLRWTMEGKTAWELGRVLSISEQTAVKHVNSATHKLGCTSKHQAVLKALRLGLIH